MTGKVAISYNWSFDNGYEAYLSWKSLNDEHEMLVGRDALSWLAARDQAIEKFKKIPESEELEIR